jgi:hypothetical protein
MEEARSKKLEKNFFASLMQQVNISSIAQAQDKLMRWTTEAKREHIEEHANINVPEQYKSQYEDMRLKHFKVVSIGKNDL